MSYSLEKISANTQSSAWGVAYMMTGMLIIPGMDAIAKLLGNDISPMQITWGRFFFQIIFIGLAIVIALEPSALKSSRPLVHTLRGILLAIATTLFFFSLLYLPLANAISIFFVQPMILTLLSALFLGETIGWHRRIAVTTGFFGVLLIIQPGSESFILASLLPLGAALFFATYIVLTRSVANVDHPLTMQFSSSLGAVLILTIALMFAGFTGDSPFSPTMPSLSQWGFLALIGIIASVGHLLVVIAINRTPASLLAPFGYMEIVSATALGWWIFGEWPDQLAWLGIAVIVGSGMYVLFRENQQSSASLRGRNT